MTHTFRIHQINFVGYFFLTPMSVSSLLQLLNLCEAEDAALMKLPCYKSLPSLVPLRIAALSEWILSKLILNLCEFWC